jgi:hypothetical protein
MTQLAFPFIGEPEPASSRPSAYRRRLKRVAELAYALGLRRRAKSEAVAKELVKESLPQRRSGNPTDVIGGQKTQPPIPRPAPLPVLAFHATAQDRSELAIIIKRLERLNVSHRSPEDFFIERSEIVHALRRIAGQGEIVKCRARR